MPQNSVMFNLHALGWMVRPLDRMNNHMQFFRCSCSWLRIEMDGVGPSKKICIVETKLQYPMLQVLQMIRGVGCMYVGEALLPYRNATNIFLQI
jgi:hypothetical protein